MNTSISAIVLFMRIRADCGSDCPGELFHPTLPGEYKNRINSWKKTRYPPERPREFHLRHLRLSPEYDTPWIVTGINCFSRVRDQRSDGGEDIHPI